MNHKARWLAEHFTARADGFGAEHLGLNGWYSTDDYPTIRSKPEKWRIVGKPKEQNRYKVRFQICAHGVSEFKADSPTEVAAHAHIRNIEAELVHPALGPWTTRIKQIELISG